LYSGRGGLKISSTRAPSGPLTRNPDPLRRTPATPQADALLLATIKAVGIVQPPIISPQQDGGNGYYIQYGHRRVTQSTRLS
jgi:ParB family transcriptional regulator, chromosome partitioning protein